MSRGLICDQCGEVLAVNANGDDDAGESSAWLAVDTTFGRFDLCTRACVVALMDDEDFVAHVEAGQAAVAEVVQALREAREDDDDA